MVYFVDIKRYQSNLVSSTGNIRLPVPGDRGRVYSKSLIFPGRAFADTIRIVAGKRTAKGNLKLPILSAKFPELTGGSQSPYLKISLSVNYTKFLQQINAKNKAAYSGLYRLYGVALRKHALYFSLNEQAADQVVRKTINAFFEASDTTVQFKNMADLDNAVYNVAREYIMIRLGRPEKQHIQNANIQHNDKDQTTVELKVKGMLLLQLYQAIEKLPSLRKVIFKMYYLEGQSCEQIALKMVVTPESVQKFIDNCLVEFAQILFPQQKVIPLNTDLLYNQSFRDEKR